MKNLNTQKLFAITITTLLLLSIMATIIPYASAAERQPHAFLSAEPNPVGVGQTVLIVMWLDLVPTTAYPGDPTKVWKDYTLTITGPDGNVETFKENSDPVASNYISWTPKQTGNYTMVFKYPGETIGSLTMLPATSPTFTLTVQDQSIPDWRRMHLCQANTGLDPSKQQTVHGRALLITGMA